MASRRALQRFTASFPYPGVHEPSHIPVDGVVTLWATSANQAAMVGESLPIDKQVGDPVYAGTLNEMGALACACEQGRNRDQPRPDPPHGGTHEMRNEGNSGNGMV